MFIVLPLKRVILLPRSCEETKPSEILSCIKSPLLSKGPNILFTGSLIAWQSKHFLLKHFPSHHYCKEIAVHKAALATKSNVV